MQPTQTKDEITAARQVQLAENLAKADRALARRLAKTTPPPPSKAVTFKDHILEGSDDLLRVSAGLHAVLFFLDLQSDTQASAYTPLFRRSSNR